MTVEQEQNEVKKELTSLREEIEALQRQVKELREIQNLSLQVGFGLRSFHGLRRLGSLMYILTLPLAILAAIVRKLRLEFDYWENYYALSFTHVYLSSKEDLRLTRIKKFLPTFFLIRSRLRKN